MHSIIFTPLAGLVSRFASKHAVVLINKAIDWVDYVEIYIVRN